jgi:hypothetical protein
MDNQQIAAKLVSDNILGKEARKVTVAGKEYTIKPPTIHKIAGAAQYLANFGEAKDFNDMVEQMKSLKDTCNALSFFFNDDESLAEELSRGTLEEVTFALGVCLKMLSIKDFMTLSTLARSVARMAANPRP